jgi:SAM-dependent methyltransferase
MTDVDWGAGRYEATAEELEPVSRAVVDRAALAPGEAVADLACGTGNAALLAAAAGARVVGVDGAPRLLEVARSRAAEQGVAAEFLEGDLEALPLDDASADVVLSVFGLIFAGDPGRALGEVARILRPEGRALVTAWVPAGPIDAMLTAMRRVVARVAPAPAPPPRGVAWSDPAAVAPLAAAAGLDLHATEPAQLTIRAASAEAYVAAGQEHPMAVRLRPLLEREGLTGEVQEAMAAALREAGEARDGTLLVRSPYVVHHLRRSA